MLICLNIIVSCENCLFDAIIKNRLVADEGPSATSLSAFKCAPSKCEIVQLCAGAGNCKSEFVASCEACRFLNSATAASLRHCERSEAI